MWAYFSKAQHYNLTGEYENAYSKLTTSPNAEGLKTNHHNISPPRESRRQLIFTCKRSEILRGRESDSHKKKRLGVFRREESPTPLTYVRQRCRIILRKLRQGFRTATAYVMFWTLVVRPTTVLWTVVVSYKTYLTLVVSDGAYNKRS